MRELWRLEALPGWVTNELNLPAGSTFESLGANMWEIASFPVSRRVRNFIVNFVTARRAEIKPLNVLSSPLPPSLSALQLPWTIRTRNCLESARLLADRSMFSELIYADLLEIPAMGIVSVLDFACVAEAGISQFDLGLRAGANSSERKATHGTTEVSDLLIAAIDAPWANQVSAQDPRFADLLSPHGGTVFERIDQLTDQPSEDPTAEVRLAEAVASIQDRIEKLSQLSLDKALLQFLEDLSGLQGLKLEALSARFGWSGKPPITLEEAGAMLGVTREWIRQLQKRTLDRVPQHPVFMPLLDKAMKLLRERAPVDLETAGKLLRDYGLTSVDFRPESVLSAAKTCGRTATFQIKRTGGRVAVVTTEHGEYANLLTSFAQRQSAASGASNVQEVLAESDILGTDIDESTAKEILTLYSEVEFLDEEWFWYPKGKLERNRLRNTTRRMLSVTAPIPLSILREGIRREYQRRGARGLGKWPLVVPSRAIMRRFFEAHPEFTIDPTGFVNPVKPLDYRVELAPTEQIFVDVLRSSPAGVLDRASYAQGCFERGMNQNTFSGYLTYSCVIAHLGTDIWSLRGVRVDPAAVEAVRRANAARPPERRVLNHGWTENGSLWVAVRIPESLSGFVFGVPGAIKRMVADREFSASDEKGTPYGSVVVSDIGSSYGYGPFLRRRGADKDDILIVEFDLVAGTSVLRLGDDELLEEWDPTL